MEELNQKRIDRAVLVGLNADCFPKEETATETTLDELEAVLNTAGGECAGKILQNKHTPDPRSFIGEGKAEEVRQLVLSTGANMVIFDNDLTPSQTRTLEDILKTTVLDRSALILDIFAQRAKTREGKLQVELAQYQYYLPRLTVWNEEMGRLGGGIGTRGPGETQLETDKRYIRSRIQKLRENLEDVRKVRAEQDAAEVPRHDAQHILYALTLEHVQDRLSGGALRLAVVAVALLAGVQDVGPAVVPGVIFPLLDGLELRPGLRLGRHGEDEAEKAGFFFDIFRISLPRGDPELLHQTSSVTY